MAFLTVRLTQKTYKTPHLKQTVAKPYEVTWTTYAEYFHRRNYIYLGKKRQNGYFLSTQTSKGIV